MIPGLALLEKVVIFAIDLFIKNSARKEELRKSFDKFFQKSARDSQFSADLNEEYLQNRKVESWQKDTNSKN